MDLKTGLTFSDVLLIPKRTHLNSRSEAKTKTKLTRNLSLNIPLVSSNMASVTEHKTAIAMAREGGIGIIHQFNTIEEQVMEVKKVKKSTSYIIENPLSTSPEITIKEAIEIMKSQEVTSILVVENQKLVGIFTRRDYLFEPDLNKKISEVMTPREKIITAKNNISLDEAKLILHKNRIEKLPLLENEIPLRLITTQDIKKLEFWPDAARDKKGRLLVAAAVGVKDTLERASELIKADVDLIILDIAHAHSDIIIEKIRELKAIFPDTDILVGNIATKEAAKDLIEAGADGLKVGIGPSPVCTTRIISGSGIPQLTAIIDVSKIAKQHNIPVCADGGCKYPGDLVKAIAAGASTICSGSFFAGTDEAPGLIITKDGKRYKRYIGSASYDSNHERKEKLEKRQLKNKINVFVEGVPTLIDYKGSIEETIKTLVKGLKSGISYSGATDIQELQENGEFIKITSNSWNESQARGDKLSD